MRSMVGHDRVDCTVDDALANRLGIGLGAQRRIDLECSVVSLVDIVLGKEHVVRGRLAGNADALLLGTTDELEAMGGGNMLDVQLGAGKFGHLDVASDLNLLALRRPTKQAQTRGNGALIDLAVAHEVLVLAVAHEDLAEHLAVVHATAHHAGTLDTAAVIGESDSAAGDHIAHLGKSLALEAARASARGEHAAMANGGSTRLDVLDNRAVIGHGIGVGHGANAGETALGGSTGAALDVLLVLITGLTEMNMHVNETGNEILARHIEDGGVTRLEVGCDSGDLIALDQNIADLIKAGSRIDHMCRFKQKGHYRNLQAAGTGQPCARRYRSRPAPGSPSATGNRPYRNRARRRD